MKRGEVKLRDATATTSRRALLARSCRYPTRTQIVFSFELFVLATIRLHLSISPPCAAVASLERFPPNLARLACSPAAAPSAAVPSAAVPSAAMPSSVEPSSAFNRSASSAVPSSVEPSSAFNRSAFVCSAFVCGAFVCLQPQCLRLCLSRQNSATCLACLF